MFGDPVARIRQGLAEAVEFERQTADGLVAPVALLPDEQPHGAIQRFIARVMLCEQAVEHGQLQRARLPFIEDGDLQVEHLLEVAALEGREADLRAALERAIVVGSVGPTTSETLRAHQMPVDIEPEHPKMGHLVNAVASRSRIRLRISVAAASVKVTIRISSRLAGSDPFKTHARQRSTSVLVLPEPAPATTATLPGARITRCC